MTNYVGPRATMSINRGEHYCPRCAGRGNLRFDAGGQSIRRTSYTETAFWRQCSVCQGTGQIVGAARRAA